jgi:hypothetical protein
MSATPYPNLDAQISSKFGIYRQVHTQKFSLGEGGNDPEAIYNLCLILKIML